MEGIYILHYSGKDPSGGQHYTGLSKNLLHRITSHSLGTGSKHTKKMHDSGHTFVIGGVFDYEPTIKQEKAMKFQTKRRCLICNGDKDTAHLRRDWIAEIQLAISSSPSN